MDKHIQKKEERVLAKAPPRGYLGDLPDNLQREYIGASYVVGGGKTEMARWFS